MLLLASNLYAHNIVQCTITNHNRHILETPNITHPKLLFLVRGTKINDAQNFSVMKVTYYRIKH